MASKTAQFGVIAVLLASAGAAFSGSRELVALSIEGELTLQVQHP